MTTRVALVQCRTPRDPRAALAHLEPWVRAAAAAGARLVLTPEGSNRLDRNRESLLPALGPAETDPVVRGLAALAVELDLEILIGSALLREDGAAVNRSLLFGPDGGLRALYDKIHMFDVDLPDGQRIREGEVYRRGRAAPVIATRAGRLGLTICYDLRFPHLFRALARAGADLIAVPSAFTRVTGAAHWEPLLRARAIETGAFILAPAQGGRHEDGRETYGRSLVVSPWGEVIAALDDAEPAVLTADLDLAAVSAARRAVPSLEANPEFEVHRVAAADPALEAGSGERASGAAA